jgi:tetratricopeptide (TPR) repeat protein
MSWYEVGATFRRVHFPTGTGGYYQPLTALSLMLDAYLTTDWASRAFEFHLTNLFLHLSNVALLFVLVRLVSASTFWAALSALIFGLHPVQVESVAWVAQRMTLLATTYSLLALIFYLRYATSGRIRWLLPVILLYAAAILSKPTFIGLPVVFLILDVWPLGRGGRRSGRLAWRPIIEKAPLLVLLIACAALHLRLHSLTEPASPPGVGGLELVARNVSSLAARTVWPVNLTPFRPLVGEAASLSSGLQHGLATATHLAILILLTAVLFGSFWLSRPLFAAFAGAVVLVFPELFNAPLTDELLGDHCLYPVLIMPLLAWAAWVKTRGYLLHQPWGRCLATALAAVALVFAVRSYLQSFVWQGSRELYLHTIALYPHWPRGHVGLVESLIQEGDLDLALHRAKKAIDIAPDDPTIQFYLGRVLLLHKDGRSSEAIPPLRAALASDPDWIDCLANLGIALTDTGQLDEAIRYLERARDLRPRSPGIRIALGKAYLEADRPASARGEFQLALKERNHPSAHLGLAQAWAANEMPELARRHLAAAVAQDPRYAALAARNPDLRRLRHEPGFESLIDTSPGVVESEQVDP